MGGTSQRSAESSAQSSSSSSGGSHDRIVRHHPNQEVHHQPSASAQAVCMRDDPPWSCWRLEERCEGQACEDVQGCRPELHPVVWVQGRLWRWPQHWFWHDLRQSNGGKEVRAKVPADEVWNGHCEDDCS